MAIALLGLAACSGGEAPSSSSVEASTSSSSSISEPSSSSDSPSSSSIDETSSSEISSSSSSSSVPTPQGGWNEGDLAVISSVIGDHELPYADFPAIGKSYTLEKVTDDEGNPLLAIVVNDFAYEDIAEVISIWTEGNVFTDVTSSQSNLPIGVSVLYGTYSDGTSLKVEMYLLDSSDVHIDDGVGTFYIDVYPLSVTSNDWEGALSDLNELLKTYLDLGPIDLPKPSSGNDYLAHRVLVDYSYYVQLEISGVRDGSYLEEMKEAGYREIADLLESGNYLVSPDDSLGIVFTYESSLSGSKVVLEFYLNSYHLSWPSEKILKDISLLVGKETSVNIPEPSFLSSAEYVEVAESYIDEGNFGIYIYGGDWVNEYLTQLDSSSSFLPVAYSVSDSSYTYSDVARTFLIDVAYSSAYGSTNIYITPNNEHYVTSWPEADIAGVVSSFGGTKTTVPIPSFAWEFGVITDNRSFGGSYEIDLKTVKEDGTLLDTMDLYVAQLNASGSGWSYDSSQGLWINEEGNISIRLIFAARYGLEIFIKNYSA